MTTEEEVWKSVDPNDCWVLDKLILSMKLGYSCGPVGVDVPKPDWYVVRPVINALGLGLGTKKVWIEKSTDTLPVGHFWCEWFEGRHISVDYVNCEQVLAVEGFKENKTFTKWDRWEVVDWKEDLPEFLTELGNKYGILNVEFIGDKIIEVHFRNNPDFTFDNSVFIPVWEGQSIEPPSGFKFVQCPDVHGRIGAFIS